ncbi:hypothetical protein [Saccharothrix australiensis]|uniref:Uncharacterized protein n=1 Tax=Saccharothrix australiensis TaxID=2072 RepID=A0A495W433_9PSEU|nr:hypothetical protein [Saccharothrix australiensis]RKT54558.1 hypothetical protein C8E97_3202 [Saccharothrix australiensis]
MNAPQPGREVAAPPVAALPAATFGGELEALVVDATGALAPMSPELRREAAARIAGETRLRGDLDLHGESAEVGWDLVRSTPELNLGVHDAVTGVVRWAHRSVAQLNHVLHDAGLGLLATAFHPRATEEDSYRHVTDKPLYRLFRGTSQGPAATVTEGERAMLAAAWPVDPHRGRGFDHTAPVPTAGVHVWNRTEPDTAGSHLALVAALGWLVNLVTANGPLRRGRLAARDTRLSAVERMLAPSRFPRDVLLAGPPPHRPRGLADYLRWVLSFRPLAVAEPDEAGTAWQRPLAVIPPDDAPATWSTLDFLELDRCRVVGPDGEPRWVRPRFAHLCNGGDWFYWPSTGGRLRVLAPRPEEVGARDFAEAVRAGDDAALADLLTRAGAAGCDAGALCIEGRAAATVLPCPLWGEHGDRFTAVPFVLQTAVLRAHHEIWEVLDRTGLSWRELTVDLPARTNRIGGFGARIGPVAVRDLAREVWRVAARALTAAELALVGDTVDVVLERAKAPAELQLDFLADRTRRGDPAPDAVDALLEVLRVPLTP